MESNQLPLVSIQCLVYNHEPYLRQCLDGFVMQKTNFKFEAIVHDDVSTDGSAEIIREYAERFPSIIKPIYETENQYSKQDGSLNRIMREACKGKYIALCEGDDYWIDPLKLQKQVDFLEANPDYGLIYTRTKHLYEDQSLVVEPIMSECDTISLLERNPIRTLSILFSASLYEQFLDFAKKELTATYDYPIFLWFSHYSRIKYIPDITGVYRILANSASHSDDASKIYKFEDNCLEVRKYWCFRMNVNFEKYEYLHLRKCYYYALKKNDVEGLCKYRKAIRTFYKDHNISYSNRIMLVYIEGLDISLSRVIQFLLPLYRKVRTLYRRLK